MNTIPQNISKLYIEYKNNKNIKSNYFLKNVFYQKYYSGLKKQGNAYINYDENFLNFKEDIKIELVRLGLSSSILLYIDNDYENGIKISFLDSSIAKLNYFDQNGLYKDNSDLFLHISYILPYYYLGNIKNTGINNNEIKTIQKYLKSIGYEEISPELLETELDIIGNDFMPYDAWVEKAKEQYKENYINDDDYYIDEMNAPGYPKDRVKDFETYCKEEYEGPFKVSHLLLGENFNWVLE